MIAIYYNCLNLHVVLTTPFMFLMHNKISRMLLILKISMQLEVAFHYCTLFGARSHSLATLDDQISLREIRRSVGQNWQISELSGEFCQLVGQYVRQKIIIKKYAQTVFWVTWSSMDENCTYFLCILTVFHQICSVYCIWKD